MSVLRKWVLKSIIECGIVITVIRIDELIVDIIKIFLPRESPTFFQRCSGTTTREVSATTSAAGNQNLSTIYAIEAQRDTH
jgi:hypothetical protein